MSDYIPSTDEVRQAYRAGALPHPYPRAEYRNQDTMSSDFDRWLADHDAELLEKAADSCPLNSLASARFIASDGYPSVGINTNAEALEQVQQWLRALAEGYV